MSSNIPITLWLVTFSLHDVEVQRGKVSNAPIISGRVVPIVTPGTVTIWLVQQRRIALKAVFDTTHIPSFDVVSRNRDKPETETHQIIRCVLSSTIHSLIKAAKMFL